MPNFTTRAFLPADYESVVQLWKASEGIEIAEGDSRADIGGYLERNPGFSRIAEQDGRIVGAVLCGHDGRRGVIYHLAVAGDARANGIGRALLNECFNALRSAGIKRALLLVGKGNETGQAFWLSQGFEHIAEALPFGRDIL